MKGVAGNEEFSLTTKNVKLAFYQVLDAGGCLHLFNTRTFCGGHLQLDVSFSLGLDHGPYFSS